MRAFCLALIATLALTAPAFADAPIRFQDPEKFAIGLFGTPPRINATQMAKTIAATVGKPSVAGALEKPLSIFDGKKIEVFKKVVDNDYGGALRADHLLCLLGRCCLFLFSLQFQDDRRGVDVVEFHVQE